MASLSGPFTAGISGITTTSSTSYTLSAADNGTIINFTSGSAITLNTVSGLGANFACTIVQNGAGQITFVAGSGTTISSYASATKTSGQYAVTTLFAPVANAFILAGNVGV